MATFRTFEEIEAWQKARELVGAVYSATRNGAFAKDYGLGNQIRRAAVSVLSNIAEGYERDGKGEFLQFLSVAKGSLGEVKAQLYVALDQAYIDKPHFDCMISLTGETGRLIAGLMAYLRGTHIRGSKFK